MIAIKDLTITYEPKDIKPFTAQAIVGNIPVEGWGLTIADALVALSRDIEGVFHDCEIER